MIYIIANEICALATMFLVFPGIFKIPDRLGVFIVFLMFFCISFVWFVYLALFPVTLLILYCTDKNFSFLELYK